MSFGSVSLYQAWTAISFVCPIDPISSTFLFLLRVRLPRLIPLRDSVAEVEGGLGAEVRDPDHQQVFAHAGWRSPSWPTRVPHPFHL